MMLYLDASALAKRYFTEKGSELISARFETGEIIFTSVLSYAEVHTAIARKYREREYDLAECDRLRQAFQHDWMMSLSKLEVDFRTLIALPRLVENFNLRAGDAVHLSSAVWLKDSLRTGSVAARMEEGVEFGVADKRLAGIASQLGLEVFDPERN